MPAIFNPPLSTQRYMYVENFLMQNPQITSITDVGCGNGRMVNWTKTVPHIERINCLDSDVHMLEYEMDRYLRPNLLERLFGRKNSDKEVFIHVFQGDIAVPDDRLQSDCFVLIEMIEHITLEHLETVSKTIFGYYQPKYVIVSTPNTEFNHLLDKQDPESASTDRNKPKDPNNKFRHFDHKFEWTRAEFQQWAQIICGHFNYEYQLDGVGHLPGQSEPYGPCTQIAIFQRKASEPIPLDQGDLSCFDLLLKKLSVEENQAECLGDRTNKRICLMNTFSVPGNTHLQCEPQQYVSLDWDPDYTAPGTASSQSQNESVSQEDSYEDNEEQEEDCDMAEHDDQPQYPVFADLGPW